jgi:WD40 repeat protein
MKTRRLSRLSLATVALGAFGLWWFFPRENPNVWRFAPDVSLHGGGSRARSVVFAPDGRSLAVSTLVFPATYPRTAHSNGSRQRRCEVQIWDLASRQRRKSIVVSDADYPRGASEPEMAFSPDGRQLRFWGIGTKTWDVGSSALLSAQAFGQKSPDEEIFGLPLHPWIGNRRLESNCREINFSRDKLLCAAAFLNSAGTFSGEFIKVWKRSSARLPWKEVGTLPASTFGAEIIYDIALSRDGKLMAVAVQDGTLRLFKTAPLQDWKTLSSTSWIPRITFSPDARYLIGSGRDVRVGYSRGGDVVKFWNINSGESEHTITLPKTLLDTVVSPDGRWIAGIEGESTVYVCKSPLVATTNTGPQ